MATNHESDPAPRPKLGWLATPAVRPPDWALPMWRAPLEGSLPTAQLLGRSQSVALEAPAARLPLWARPMWHAPLEGFQSVPTAQQVGWLQPAAVPLEAARQPPFARPMRHARLETARSWPTAEPGWRARVALVTPAAQRDAPLQVSRSVRATAQQSWLLAKAAWRPGLPSARPKLGWLAAPAVRPPVWALPMWRAPLEGFVPTAPPCWQHCESDLCSSCRWVALKA